MRSRLGRQIGVASFIAAIGVLTQCDLALGCSTKDKAYLTAMKSDLRSLVSAESTLRASTGRYSDNLAELRFRPITGVTAPAFDAFTADGWTASVRHQVLPTACHIFIGPRPQHAPASLRAGEPWCDDYETTSERHGTIAALLLLGFLAMTIAAAYAFRPAPGSRNWAAMGIAIAMLAHLLLLTGTSCGIRVDVLSLVPFVGAALIFTYALRRRIRGA